MPYTAGVSCYKQPTNGTVTTDKKSFTCARGYYRSGLKCNICEPGYWCTNSSRGQCGEGYFQSKSGQDWCQKVPTNSKSTSDRSGYTCNEGYYKGSGNTCILCPKGYKCTGGKSAYCGNSSYQPSEGQNSCISCANKNYSSYSSATKCGKIYDLKIDKCDLSGAFSGSNYYISINAITVSNNGHTAVPPGTQYLKTRITLCEDQRGITCRSLDRSSDWLGYYKLEIKPGARTGWSKQTQKVDILTFLKKQNYYLGCEITGDGVHGGKSWLSSGDSFYNKYGTPLIR